MGDDPAVITSDAVPSAVASGSSISYQWQSWTYGVGSFIDSLFSSLPLFFNK